MNLEHKTQEQPINYFPNGSMVRVVSLDAGKCAFSRLCAMGLVPGTLVQVFRNGKGPVRLKFRDTELVLGRSFAEKIIARLTRNND
ncbi:MAG: ferrous iron transport protein A [Desulfonatronovibrio sp.]